MIVLIRYLVLAGIVLLLVGAVVRPLSRRLRSMRSESAPDDSPDFLAALDDEVKRRRGERPQARPPTSKIDQSAIDDTIARYEEEFGKTDEPPGSPPGSPPAS